MTSIFRQRPEPTDKRAAAHRASAMKALNAQRAQFKKESALPGQ